MSDPARMIEHLREQLEERDETIRQLRAQLSETAPLPSWVPHMSGHEETMFRLLWKREFVSREVLQSQFGEEVANPQNMMNAYIMRLRRKLGSVGITIENIHSRGYRLDDQSRSLLRSAA